MISSYHRPTTLAEALELLAQPSHVPLGGGTVINAAQGKFPPGSGDAAISVVDLQALGLNSLQEKGDHLEVGATVTLQQLLESEEGEALSAALRLEAPINIRNLATVAGTIVACDGRSSFVTALLALDAQLSVIHLEGSKRHTMLSLGDFLPLRPRLLITGITIPLKAQLAFEKVSRTPADIPIACIAVAQWPSGRTRLAVGGWGSAPLLAMDGPEIEGAEHAARNVCSHAADEWASAEYRAAMAETLTRRAAQQISSQKGTA